MYRRTDRFCFIFGIIVLGPVVLLGLLINRGFFDFVHGMDLCSFHRYTGLYCPGCGLTRSCLSLFTGHPILSLSYHIAPIAAIIFYLVYMVYLFYLRSVLKKRVLSMRSDYPQDIECRNIAFHKRLEAVLYVIIGVIFLGCIVRNILLSVYDFDWLLSLPFQSALT